MKSKDLIKYGVYKDKTNNDIIYIGVGENKKHHFLFYENEGYDEMEYLRGQFKNWKEILDILKISYSEKNDILYNYFIVNFDDDDYRFDLIRYNRMANIPREEKIIVKLNFT